MDICLVVDITRSPDIGVVTNHVVDFRASGSMGAYHSPIHIQNDSNVLSGMSLVKMASILRSGSVAERFYAFDANQRAYTLLGVRYRNDCQMTPLCASVFGINRLRDLRQLALVGPTTIVAVATYVASLRPDANLTIRRESTLDEEVVWMGAYCPANASHVWYDVEHIRHTLSRAESGGIDRTYLEEMVSAVDSITQTSGGRAIMGSDDTITLEHCWRDAPEREIRSRCGPRAFDPTLLPQRPLTEITHANPAWLGDVADALVEIPYTDMTVTMILPAGHTQVLPTPIVCNLMDRYGLATGTKEVDLTRVFNQVSGIFIARYQRSTGMPVDFIVTITKDFSDIARITFDVEGVDQPVFDVYLDLFYMQAFGHGMAVAPHLLPLPTPVRDIDRWQ